MIVAPLIKTRYIANKDLNRVLEINSSSDPYRLTKKEIVSNLKSRFGMGLAAVNEDDYLLGICLYNLKATEFFEIDHLVVDADARRTGVGTCLINKMKKKLNKDRPSLIMNVLETNLPMQLFLKNMKFNSKLIRARDEDVIRFTFGG